MIGHATVQSSVLPPLQGGSTFSPRHDLSCSPAPDRGLVIGQRNMSRRDTHPSQQKGLNAGMCLAQCLASAFCHEN